MAKFCEEHRRFECECPEDCHVEINSWSTWAKGHHMKTEEYKKRCSEDKTGREVSEETRGTLSKSGLEFWNSPEGLRQREAGRTTGLTYFRLDQSTSERMTKWWASPEGRVEADKKSRDYTGRTCTPQTVENMEESQRDHWSSPAGDRRKQEYSERMTGAGNPRWKGGECHYGYGWAAVRDLIWLRDQWICQGCGSEEDLVVHHIDGDTLNLDFRNLITVCRGCNNRAAMVDQEEYWFNFYTSRIVVIYSDLSMPTIFEGVIL